MRTIKKKAFKKTVMESESVDEFVNDNGGIIGGDEKYNKGVDVKTGPINMPGDEKGLALTTNKHAANAIQPRNWWWSLTYGYGMGGGRTSMGNNLQGLNGDNIGDGIGESLEEGELTAEQNMKNMVEDILSKKSNSQDLVNKKFNSDVNRNKIPDIEELSDTKMIITSKLKDLIKSIDSSNLSGEEVGIILNYLMSSVNTSKIPSDYKNIIRKQL